MLKYNVNTYSKQKKNEYNLKQIILTLNELLNMHAHV